MLYYFRVFQEVMIIVNKINEKYTIALPRQYQMTHFMSGNLALTYFFITWKVMQESQLSVKCSAITYLSPNFN